jgi:hypothetical protein
MRKIFRFTICLVVLSMAVTTARGQIRFGLKGGLNISSVKLSKDILAADNRTGFHIGPMIETMIPYTGLGVDIAFLYSQKGINADWESWNTDYIDVPVNLKWKAGLPGLKGYAAAGPFVSFCVNGDKIWKMPGSVANQIKAKSFGAGINLGAGAELLNFLQIGFNYALGLTDNYNIYKDGNSSGAKTRTWSISAALLF